MSSLVQGNFSEMIRKEGSAPAMATERPIDLVYLSKFTMGDKDLEREVLNLFAVYSEIYLDRMKDAVSDREWLEAAHTLKGSASGIGAWRVANYAGEAERLGGADRSKRSISAIKELSACVNEANTYIEDLMKEAG